MEEEKEYLKEISWSFGARHEVGLFLMEYIETLTTVEEWVNLLIFVREQSKAPKLSYDEGDEEGKMKIERTIHKCYWVGQKLYPDLLCRVPSTLFIEVLNKLSKSHESYREDRITKMLEDLKNMKMLPEPPSAKLLEKLGNEKMSTEELTVFNLAKEENSDLEDRQWSYF